MGERARQYAAFRATHQPGTVRVAGLIWEYLIAGRGEETLLLLPGGFGAVDTSFRYVLAFEGDFRVLSLAYPAEVATVAALVDGIRGVLDALGIARVQVLGGSYSGLIAQHLVRRAPERVTTLILSHTGVPRHDRARRLASLVRLLAALPPPLPRGLLWLATYSFLPRPTPEHAFWRRHFHATIATTTKAACLNRLRVAIDIDRHSAFGPGDLAGWPGRLLIVEAAGDRLVSPAERAALRALYPTALVVTLPARAHGGTIDQPEAEIAVIRRFLCPLAL